MKTLINILILSLLFACGANNQTETNQAPTKSIHEAAFFGDLTTINQHIKAGTDLNQKDEYGSTPLNIAITFNKEAVASALIEGGADLTVKTPDGSTPLHTASFLGRTSIVKMLINQNVDINATNSFGATALESVTAPFETVKPIYDQLSKDLGPLGFKLNYKELQSARKEIVNLLSK